MLLHASPLQTPYQLILGVILAVIVLKTGNLFYSILLHFLNNAIAVTLEFSGLADETAAVTPLMAMVSMGLVVAGAVCFILAVRYFYKLPCKSKENNENKDVFSSETNTNISESVFHEEKLSDNAVMDRILKAQIKSQRTAETILTSVLYGVGVLICVTMWIMLFIQGLA